MADKEKMILVVSDEDYLQSIKNIFEKKYELIIINNSGEEMYEICDNYPNAAYIIIQCPLFEDALTFNLVRHLRSRYSGFMIGISTVHALYSQLMKDSGCNDVISCDIDSADFIADSLNEIIISLNNLQT